MRRLAVLFTAALLATTSLLAACGAGPSSSAPRIRDGNAGSGGSGYREDWTGGPFTLSHPAISPPPVRDCPAQGQALAVATPVCDYHRITPNGAGTVVVTIHAAEGFEGDDYDLYVYDDKGTAIAASATSADTESVLFQDTGAPWYEVRVQPYLVSPGSRYAGTAAATPQQAFDTALDCSDGVVTGEDVPASAGMAGVTDSGQEVELSVALLLDGVDPGTAQAVVERAAVAYAPLHVKLVLHSLKPVSLTSTTSDGLIAEAKLAAGGAPPAGADVIGVLTAKQMQSADAAGAGTVIGQADCIGGIRARNNSFFVVSDLTAQEHDEFLPGVFLYYDATAETLAHEIGHLLGAQHHYANCTEGIPSSGGPGDVSPCTEMFPQVDGASLVFGTLEGAVVRGHAVQYASP